MNHLNFRQCQHLGGVAFSLLAVLACAGLAFAQETAPAQSADVAYLWANLKLPGGSPDWVVMDLRAHVMRDASGGIHSGGIGWRLRYNVSGPFQASGYRIYQK